MKSLHSQCACNSMSGTDCQCTAYKNIITLHTDASTQEHASATMLIICSYNRTLYSSLAAEQKHSLGPTRTTLQERLEQHQKDL